MDKEKIIEGKPPQPKWDLSVYYDKNGVEIENGDLLEIFHFIHYERRRKCYMYHVAILEDYMGFSVWRGRDYNAPKSHYNLHAVADKETGFIWHARILSKPKWETSDQKRKEGRKRLKINTPTT
jgi:hypothetical protein